MQHIFLAVAPHTIFYFTLSRRNHHFVISLFFLSPQRYHFVLPWFFISSSQIIILSCSKCRPIPLQLAVSSACSTHKIHFSLTEIFISHGFFYLSRIFLSLTDDTDLHRFTQIIFDYLRWHRLFHYAHFLKSPPFRGRLVGAFCRMRNKPFISKMGE